MLNFIILLFKEGIYFVTYDMYLCYLYLKIQNSTVLSQIEKAFLSSKISIPRWLRYHVLFYKHELQHTEDFSQPPLLTRLELSQIKKLERK